MSANDVYDERTEDLLEQLEDLGAKFSLLLLRIGLLSANPDACRDTCINAAIQMDLAMVLAERAIVMMRPKPARQRENRPGRPPRKASRRWRKFDRRAVHRPRSNARGVFYTPTSL